jgi:hypothetical protein
VSSAKNPFFITHPVEKISGDITFWNYTTSA